MPDSTNHFIIREGERYVLSVKDFEGDGKNPEILIDMTTQRRSFLFSLAMPKAVLRELAEKAQEFLDKTEPEVQDQAKREDIPVHAEG